MECKGRALVTGASRGIGRALALELATRGFDVLATMRKPEAGSDMEREAARRGLSLKLERLDLEDPDSVRIPDGLRMLINNAGIECEYLPVEHLPSEAWRRVFETNLFGLLEVTRRAIPKLRAAGGGVICNITSSSILAPMPFYAAYRASKAAVSALGESLRAELAPCGIRLVEILPGPIETDMLRASAREPEAAKFADYRDQARRAHEARNQAAQKSCSPDDAARRIITAVLDDEGPLRYGCDPLGEGLLAAWRSQSDEDLMVGMLKAFMPAE